MFSFYHQLKENANESKVNDLIDQAYRENVNQIYQMVQERVLKKDELTSHLHLNSQIKQFKYNFLETWLSLKVVEGESEN